MHPTLRLHNTFTIRQCVQEHVYKPTCNLKKTEGYTNNHAAAANACESGPKNCIFANKIELTSGPASSKHTNSQSQFKIAKCTSSFHSRGKHPSSVRQTIQKHAINSKFTVLLHTRQLWAAFQSITHHQHFNTTKPSSTWRTKRKPITYG